MIFMSYVPHNIFALLPCVLRGHAALSDCQLVVPPGIFHSSLHPNPGKFPENSKEDKIDGRYIRYSV